MTKQEYDRLNHDSIRLGALMGAGVDSWEGYDEAFRDLYEEPDVTSF